MESTSDNLNKRGVRRSFRRSLSPSLLHAADGELLFGTSWLRLDDEIDEEKKMTSSSSSGSHHRHHGTPKRPLSHQPHRQQQPRRFRSRSRSRSASLESGDAVFSDTNKEIEKGSTSRRPARRRKSLDDMDTDDEKHAHSSSSPGAKLDANSDIRFEYLTFATPLPAPHIPYTPDFNIATLPTPPDWNLYVDPQLWPNSRKSVMLAVSCIATCLTAYTAGAWSPAAYLLAAEAGSTHELALLGVTTFCLGFAIAPMVLAPLSEIYGRYPVFAAAGVVFVVFQAACGLATNLVGLLFVRFFLGVGSSVFSTMVGGIISDLYPKETRNTPMSLFSGAVLVGTGLGPLVSAIIIQRTELLGGQTWKWVFWHQVIADFILGIAVVILFKESRGSVVLTRKAKALNKWYDELEKSDVFGVWMAEDADAIPDSPATDIEKRPSSLGAKEGLQPRRIRWLVEEDEQRGSLMNMVRTSLTRPFHFLFTEPIVFFFSLWVSFAWAVLYLTFGSIPYVFETEYGFNAEQAGFVFAAMIAGAILATILGIYQEDLLRHPQWRGKSNGQGADSGDEIELRTDGIWAFLRRRFPVESPESRLYFTCFSAVLLPAGLFLFGFSSDPSIHFIVPAIGIALATAGIYYVYLATFNYLADIYHLYASSALAAQSFCRNVLGGVFPLATIPLFSNLRPSGAGGLLGGIALVLTVVPFILVLFGERIRRRSSFAVALEKHT